MVDDVQAIMMSGTGIVNIDTRLYVTRIKGTESHKQSALRLTYGYTLLFSVFLWQLAEYSWHWQITHQELYYTSICYSTIIRLFTGTVRNMTALVMYNCNQLSQYHKRKRQWQKVETGKQCVIHVFNGHCNIIDTDDTIKRSKSLETCLNKGKTTEIHTRTIVKIQ